MESAALTMLQIFSFLVEDHRTRREVFLSAELHKMWSQHAAAFRELFSIEIPVGLLVRISTGPAATQEQEKEELPTQTRWLGRRSYIWVAYQS